MQQADTEINTHMPEDTHEAWGGATIHAEQILKLPVPSPGTPAKPVTSMTIFHWSGMQIHKL